MEGHGQDRYGRPPSQQRGYGQPYRGVSVSDVSDRYSSQPQAQGFEPGPPAGSQRPGSSSYMFSSTPPQYGSQYQNNPIPYQSTFEGEAGRPSQQYQQFMPQGMVYMNQPQGSYDPSPTYAGRQQPGLGASPQQYQMPHYYANAYGSTGLQGATVPHPFQDDNPYQASAPHHQRRELVQPTYNPIDFPQQSYSMDRFMQPQQTSMQHGRMRTNDEYDEYLQKLRSAFEFIENGQLGNAGPRLLEASELILDIEKLEALGKQDDRLKRIQHNFLTYCEGLQLDVEEKAEQRRKMWNDFNICWLAFMQKLKEMLQDVLQSGQRPSQPQSVIEPAFLEDMGDKLVNWADGLERYGLVDYETGLWEEEILDGR